MRAAVESLQNGGEMDHFLVVTNKQKDPALQCTNRIRAYLEEHGKTCTVEDGEDISGLRISADTQCVIVLGGDGTVLRTARAASAAGLPIIGVNLGTLGYLAEVDSSHVEDALARLIADDFAREKRMMLSGRILRLESENAPVGKGIPENKAKISEDQEEAFGGNCALNDIAIARKGSLQIIAFHIYVNGQLLHTCHADGILVATPTGSTGYNLSAGGPIVEPHAQLILLTPICPHTLHSRTIVLSPQDEIVIEIGQNKKGTLQEVEACFDGSVKMEMHTGDKMEIKKAEKTTEMLKLCQDSFLEVLHKKMDAE